MEKAKKILKKLLIILICVAILLFIIKSEQGNKMQYMDGLNYDITLHENGDMTIVETWDIYINHTNTIFKNFEISDKFGEIKDVTVKDLGEGKNLTKIDEEMYHVTTNCYYALNVSSRVFEIAWGTGMEHKAGHKKYEITYTVTDVITDYKDCQEMYWMLLGTVNNVPIKKVTGTINLPQKVENIENLRVWGHGPLNGEIKKVSENLVEFSVDNFNPNTMLELRVVTTDKIFQNVEKIRNYNYLERILAEETNWAEEANAKSDSLNKFLIVLGVIYLIIIIYYINRLIKYKKMSKEKDDGIIKNEIKYFREIPRENDATPAEATYLYRFDKDLNSYTAYQSDMFAATILDLCLKKCISLRTADNTVYVKIKEKTIELKKDEEEIYKLLKLAAKDKEEFDIADLKTYAKKHYNTYSNVINTMINTARQSLYTMGFVNKANQKKYNKSKNAKFMFSVISTIIEAIIVAVLLSFIPFFKLTFISIFGIGYLGGFIKWGIILMPVIILKLLTLKELAGVQNKISVLTQKGYDEKQQWKGLVNYMNDFSLLKEKEVPSLVIWEKYLIYATAFGIADKVIEQMKATYPEVFVKESWEDEDQYQIIKFVTGVDYVNFHVSPINILNTNVSKAYSISLSEIAAHSSSSGSGGGGGFSGGGGGRRWPEDGMGGR